MPTSSRPTVLSTESEAPSTSTVAFAALDSTSVEAAIQTTESGLSPEMDEGDCRLCGEVEDVNRNRMWIGCEVKGCKFWRHAWCMGVTAYRESLKFYCPKPIGKKIKLLKNLNFMSNFQNT